MAFTGTAAITQLSDKKVLITGLSLAASAAGTISLQAGAGEQKPAASFDFNPWKYLAGSAITREQGIRVSAVKAAATPVAASSISIVYSGADTDAAALWTLTNTDAANASGALKIYLEILAG